MLHFPFRKTFLARDTAGIVALEYGVIASIISLVLVGIFAGFGQTVASLFTNFSTSL